jgi:hypothetical protein
MKSLRHFILLILGILTSELALAALPMNVPLDASADGYQPMMSWGVGSDGYRRPNDPKGVFYTISDRGPNVDCEDSEHVFGKEVCKEGKIFPMPSFNPSILKWSISGNQEPRLLKVIPLKNKLGIPVSGLSNPWVSAATESAKSMNGDTVPYDVEGIDPEGLVALEDGSYWISEEYGPSLLHVSSDGEILERWVPEGMEKDIAGANYPVYGKLPAILKQRKLNRGMEALTITPDGRKLIVAMQSALQNPDSSTSKSSRIVRFLTVDLKAKKVDGMYAYEMNPPQDFAIEGASKVKSGDLKISAIAYFKNKLLIQERTDDTMKIFEFKLGENLLGSKLALSQKSPTLEEKSVDSSMKKIFWDASQFAVKLPAKIEGMIVLNDTSILLVNDNDFGLTGIESEALLISP